MMDLKAIIKEHILNGYIVLCAGILLCIPISTCYGQAGQWVWMRGSHVSNQPGVFGVQGVSDSLNEPPSLYEACEWKDLNGNFWLFGGLNFSVDYGDLWKYNPSTNEWTWMKGAGTPGAPAVYGTQGVPSPLNQPPALWGGINSWTDLNGNLWMFGGGGSQTNGKSSDLWKYDTNTNEWTWVKGPGTYSSMGSYGIKGIPNITNNPPARSESAASWTDNNGDLWMFGGNSPLGTVFNDLWRYNIASNTWTWMKGSNFTNQQGWYGIKGVEDSLNTPGGRDIYCRWRDASGNLWLYGGDYFNDLWKFNIVTNNWTWMSGDSVKFSPDVYGGECAPAENNKPGMRFENRAAWKDANGNFWMMGGNGGDGNELWTYNVTTNKWMIAKMDSLHPFGVWGTKGIPDPANIPPYTWGSIGWADSNNLYLFGGGHGTSIWYNALWKFVIDTACLFPVGITDPVQEENFIAISPNPSNGQFVVEINDWLPDKKYQIEIIDGLGSRVYSDIVTDKVHVIACCQVSGVYTIRIYDGINSYCKRVVTVSD